eukprot:338249-Pyramimonas_sp.AAC.1
MPGPRARRPSTGLPPGRSGGREATPKGHAAQPGTSWVPGTTAPSAAWQGTGGATGPRRKTPRTGKDAQPSHQGAIPPGWRSTRRPGETSGSHSNAAKARTTPWEAFPCTCAP